MNIYRVKYHTDETGLVITFITAASEQLVFNAVYESFGPNNVLVYEVTKVGDAQ